MNEDVSIKSFDCIYLDGFRGYKLTPAHSLLVLNCFNGHLSSAFKQPAMQEKTPIALIPGGFTKSFSNWMYLSTDHSSRTLDTTLGKLDRWTGFTVR
jgi:hypothetical protein